MTNKDIGKALEDNPALITKDSITSNITDALNDVATTNAELMSLGSIISTKKNVTFDGGRIVVDADRLYSETDTEKKMEIGPESLVIKTNDASEVVLGYTAYDDESKTYTARQDLTDFSVSENGAETQINGYMWVKDLFQLQAIAEDGNLDDRYALRNSIDAHYTANESYQGDTSGFKPIGDATNKFTGRFDGLGYDIFGLNIKREDTNNVGLFGYAQDATIRNFTLNAGVITWGSYTGAVVGSASGGTIENIVNTADVKGGDNTGGVAGNASGANLKLSGLINVGTVNGSESIGGIVGSINGGEITGTTYNLGAVTGTSNVGGIAGLSENSQIGDAGGAQIYNSASVTGGYNVGGAVGSISGGSVANAANHGTVTAKGNTLGTYQYHSANSYDGVNIDGQAPYTEAEDDGSGDHLITVDGVYEANAGGIAGKVSDVSISNVLNDGDVKTLTEGDDEHYIAGNVGGIAGRAENTKIVNATNRENNIRGAHNVGGVAGLLADSSVTDSTNDGGDVMGTGARYVDGFVKERVREYAPANDEAYIIGNIGGVAGYLYDSTSGETDDAQVQAFIENSTNRGSVHSETIKEMEEIDKIPDTAKTANVGGIAGKVDRRDMQSLEEIRPAQTSQASGAADYKSVSIRHSYNTGDVQGYTGVGGVAGMMYNGSVARSFNTGTLKSSRQAQQGSREPLNMGGIVGDTPATTKANTVMYDVYNAGQIGDETYKLYGRHVGGIAGRLNGDIDKAYNTGDIYNGYSTVGGIAGYWVGGNISNVFNTGNITVVNKDQENALSQLGGIVGAYSGDNKDTLSYAYNLGTLRSFAPRLPQLDADGNETDKWVSNFVGGIIGNVTGNNLSIENVYTLGNMYAAKDYGSGEYEQETGEMGGIVHKIYGSNNKKTATAKNVFYIKPKDGTPFVEAFGNAQTINYNDKSNPSLYIDMADDILKPETKVSGGHTQNIPEGNAHVR